MCNVRRCLVAAAGITVMGTALVATSRGEDRAAAAVGRAGSAPSPTSPARVQLTSDHFSTPVKIPQDPAKRAITSIQLDVTLAKSGDGSGTVTLDDSPLEFNSFGDARRLSPEKAPSSEVRLRATPIQDHSERDRCVYEILFADDTFANRLVLVRTPGSPPQHRC